MVLTDEQQVDRYPAATMETGDSATEISITLIHRYLLLYLPVPFRYHTKPNDLSPISAVPMAVRDRAWYVLKVMAGDQFSIRATIWYDLRGSNTSSTVSPLTDIVPALISGVGACQELGTPCHLALQTNSRMLSNE